MYKWLLKCSLSPDIVNKVLLEHSHSRLFPNSLWLFFTTAELSNGGRDQYDLKIFTVWTSINIVFQLLNYNTISYWWIFRFFPVWGLHKQCFLEPLQPATLIMCKNSLHYMLRSGFQGLKSRNIFNFAFPPLNCISVFC